MCVKSNQRQGEKIQVVMAVVAIERTQIQATTLFMLLPEK